MTKQKLYSSFLILFIVFSTWMIKGDCQTGIANEVFGPVQQLTGPGGATYAHDSVAIFDYADDPDGFWLYQPESPKPAEAPVVVFLHGYGAYNPMIYGKWIKHLVKKGNVVIFPRYQKNLISPSPDKFIPNAVTGIKNAIEVLDSFHQIKPLLDNFSMAGHSYGGVIASGMAADFETYEIPKPKALLLCSPGSGPFNGGVLDDYQGIPEDTKLLVMVSEHDHIVGDKLGVRIFETATNTKNRNLLRQYADGYSDLAPIHAGHNECYSLDETLDSGNRNATCKRAFRSSECNTLDYNGYWKLFDALMECSKSGQYCELALGDTEEQKSLGYWSDGTAVKTLEVIVPETKELAEDSE